MPYLHLIAGPNGAGKTTLYNRVIRQPTGLPFINADEIAKVLAGGGPITEELSIQAAQLAAQRRDQMLRSGASFVTETVFSHPSKVELVRTAKAAGYTVHLHIVLVPVELSVNRVRARVCNGGHDVPEDRIRARHERLWNHVAEAIHLADIADIYDNTKATSPFKLLTRFHDGKPLTPEAPSWPTWAPSILRPDQF